MAPRDEIRSALLKWIAPQLPDVTTLPPVEIAPPRDAAHGEYASNLPLRAAKALGKKPVEIAREVVAAVSIPGICATFAPPGFLNFRLSIDRLAREAARLDAAGEGALRNVSSAGRRIHLEFVSANPTGHLHVGHGRGAVLGDALARVLRGAGAEVCCEYYVNDTGHQIDLLGRSLAAAALRALGEDAPPPADAYRGAAIEEAGGILAEREGTTLCAMDESARAHRAEAFGMEYFLDRITRDLDRIGIRFDRWVRESELHARGAVRGVVDDLAARGLLYEAEAPEGGEARVRRADSKAARTTERQVGGTFLRTSRFGDDEDRILLRKDGRPTYYTADIAYHAEKLREGFDRVIDVWGQDHASHAGRMRAALRALDLPADRLEILLVQIVRLLEGGAERKMSKRTGEAVTLRELVEEAGPDAVRFFYLLNSPDSHFDFDLDLARTRARENPVFYAQYAHARLESILAKGREMGFVPDPDARGELGEAEREVLVAVMRLRDAAEDAALALAPQLLVQSILRCAGAWHRFQTEGKADPAKRVLRSDAPRATAARLLLARAAKNAVGAGLATLGISRPEVM